MRHADDGTLLIVPIFDLHKHNIKINSTGHSVLPRVREYQVAVNGSEPVIAVLISHPGGDTSKRAIELTKDP